MCLKSSLSLRALALLWLPLLATSCAQSEDAPQPQAAEISSPAPQAKAHVVRVRYQLRSLGDASYLPARSPQVEVSYERVAYQGPNSYHLLGPSAQLHAQDVTTTTKEVELANLNTYADALPPLITVTIATEQALAAGAGPGYEVSCELVIDGQVAARTTYTAGPTSPLFVTRQFAVAHQPSRACATLVAPLAKGARLAQYFVASSAIVMNIAFCCVSIPSAPVSMRSTSAILHDIKNFQSLEDDWLALEDLLQEL
jgi:hypothetical protein